MVRFSRAADWGLCHAGHQISRSAPPGALMVTMPEAVSRINRRPEFPPRSRARMGIVQLAQDLLDRLLVPLADIQLGVFQSERIDLKHTGTAGELGIRRRREFRAQSAVQYRQSWPGIAVSAYLPG